MKKVLIITYYWPKSGGAGVQRWLKFAKYLPSFGIEPVVLTVDPNFATYPQIDESLEQDIDPSLLVYKTKCFEIYSLYRTIMHKKEVPYGGFANETSQSFAQKAANFIRGNFFLPDPRRGWNRYAYAKAKEIIKDLNIDTVITTSPPHSTQLIGLKLKKNLSIKWIADLRDPWTDIYYYNQFFHTKLASYIDRKYEKQVVNFADEIITVSEDLKRIFASKTKFSTAKKIHVIPNGYDENDFKANSQQVFESKKIITYTGTISETYDIDGLISALSQIDPEQKESLLLRFVGKIPETIIEKLKVTGIASDIVGYVPHAQAIDYMLRSTILLLVIPNVSNNKGIVTGKFFEYLASGKPILGIGPKNGDLGKLIEETKSGGIFDYQESEKMHQFILENINFAMNIESKKENYTRKALTKTLSDIIKA